MSGGAQLPGNPQQAYEFANMGGADKGAFGGTQNLTNYAAQNYGQFQDIAHQVMSGGAGAGAINNAGNTAIQAGNSLVPYATQSLQAAYDPQNANYNHQFQQQNQQSAVNNAANGASGTPYAAGVQNAGDQNFNLNWQNQQLQRQQQGAQTADALLAQQGQSAQTGANLLQSVPNEKFMALNALNTAGGQATGVDQTMIQDFLSYLTGGTGATNAATNQYSALANAALTNQQQQNQGLSGLGQLGGTLLGMFM